MKWLGVVFDLANGTVEFKELSASVPLRETKTGLWTFNFESSGKRYTCPETELLGSELEVVLQPCNFALEQEIMKTTAETPRVEDNDKASHHN